MARGLVITRHAGESFRIGADVVVTVVEGHKVRLRIEAPDDVEIVRTELDRGSGDVDGD